MAIGYVSGTQGNQAFSSGTAVYAYSSTAGNALFVNVATNVAGAFTSITDSNGHTWTALTGGATSGGGNFLVYIINSAAITSFTVNGSAGQTSVSLAEYSGVGSVVGGAVTGNGGATPMTLSKSIAGGNWFIAGLSTQAGTPTTLTQVSGNLRQQNTGFPQGCTSLFDNTGGGGSVTDSGSYSSGAPAWDAVGIEITPPATGAPSLMMTGMGF